MNALASLPVAMTWTERLTALALALQTIELLQLRHAWADDGIWRWRSLAPEHRALLAPVRWLLAQLLPERRFALLLWLRGLAAAALGLGLVRGLAPFLLITQIAICVRFRGTFNGGSDMLSVVLLGALSLAQIFADSRAAQTAALLYIAVQLTLSYFLAGVAKLQHAEWRTGGALASFIGNYGAPRWVVRGLDGTARLTVSSWGVLGFECGFPLAWSGPRACALFIGLGLCFHLGAWLVFGLNRFVFVWAAAYPALYWCSTWGR
jgi:vitamin K-dependent gamma-carboxylase-like protein